MTSHLATAGAVAADWSDARPVGVARQEALATYDQEGLCCVINEKNNGVSVHE